MILIRSTYRFRQVEFVQISAQTNTFNVNNTKMLRHPKFKYLTFSTSSTAVLARRKLKVKQKYSICSKIHTKLPQK